MHSLPVIIAKNTRKLPSAEEGPAVQVETCQRREAKPVKVIHIHKAADADPVIIIADQDLIDTPVEEMRDILRRDAEIIYAILYDWLPGPLFRDLRQLISDKKAPARRV